MPKMSRAAAPSLHVMASDDCRMRELPRRPQAATFVVASSACIALMASSLSRT
jgi:hypothetical protein